MKWLEIIELRAVGRNQDSLESQLQELIDEVNLKTTREAVKAYCHARIDNDFSVHIFHETEIVEEGGSQLGLHLTSALREFGLVNHSIWIEMHGN